MASSRTVNTMEEVLSGILHSITDAKPLPDADVPWLLELETVVLKKLQERYTVGGSQSAMPPPGSMGGSDGSDLASLLGGMGGGGGGMGPLPSGADAMAPPAAGPMSPAPPLSMPPGVNGLQSRPIPNVDELDRMLNVGAPRGTRAGGPR